MSRPHTLACFALACIGLAPPAFSAGSGAGAGGSGHQRAINSGLPPGQPGPPGSPNNRRPETVKTAPAVGESDTTRDRR